MIGNGMRGPDAGTLLIRALRSAATIAGVQIEVESIEEQPWASATFVGARHRLTITGPAIPDLRSWIDTLPEADLPIRGHIVADLIVERVDADDTRTRAVIGVLTLIAG